VNRASDHAKLFGVFVDSHYCGDSLRLGKDG